MYLNDKVILSTVDSNHVMEGIIGNYSSDSLTFVYEKNEFESVNIGQKIDLYIICL